MYTFFLTTLALLLAACGDREGPSPGPVGSRLRECGLLGEGEVHARKRSDLVSCLAACRATASCEELETRYCELSSRGALRDCEQACFEPRQCTPDKGTYTLAERCDGERQCSDGSDERGCDPVVEVPRYCESSGKRIWSFQVCNGVQDCEDDTDERGCPLVELFTCTGRVPQRIPQSQVCDLVVDCLDGSDESAREGCAQLTCPGWHGF